MSKASKSKKYFLLGLGAIVIGFSLLIVFNWMWDKSSTNDSCMSCHYHTDSDTSWKQSVHYNSKSGVMTDCAACHLPPKGTLDYTKAKLSTGMQDVWSYLTKNKEDIDWESKGELEYAQKIVYNESCKACHVNIYPEGITDEGVTAHLYYDDNEEKLGLQCISCHLDAGHYNPNYQHSALKEVPKTSGEIYASATEIKSFENYIETIPGTSASIRMIAIPSGTFTMGSPDSEPFHKADEAPQRKVEVSSFFMGEMEVTWDQFWAAFESVFASLFFESLDLSAFSSRDLLSRFDFSSFMFLSASATAFESEFFLSVTFSAFCFAASFFARSAALASALALAAARAFSI